MPYPSGGLEPPVARADLAQEDLAVYGIPLATLIDQQSRMLAAGSNFLPLHNGGYGDSSIYAYKYEGDAGTLVRDFAFEFTLPFEYVNGQTIRVNCNCRYTVGTAPATIDYEVKEISSDGTFGTDICATAQQNITTSAATYTFEVTPTGLVAGDRLNFAARASILGTGPEGAAGFYLNEVNVLLDIKG